MTFIVVQEFVNDDVNYYRTSYILTELEIIIEYRIIRIIRVIVLFTTNYIM